MTNHEKGARGERLVSLALEDAFPNAQRFDDLIIPAINGLTQIDHVLVSTAGVFVIEVKKYSGDIFGGADAAFWVQRIGSHRRTFQNPIWQNARHVSAVRWQLKLRPDQVHSIVVFVGRTELVRPVSPNVIATSAVGCSGLIRYIESFSAERLTSAEANRSLERLRQLQSAGYTREDLLLSIRERTSRCASPRLSEDSQASAWRRSERGVREDSFTWNRSTPESGTASCPSTEPPSTDFGIRYPYFRLLRWTPAIRTSLVPPTDC